MSRLLFSSPSRRHDRGVPFRPSSARGVGPAVASRSASRRHREPQASTMAAPLPTPTTPKKRRLPHSSAEHYHLHDHHHHHQQDQGYVDAVNLLPYMPPGDTAPDPEYAVQAVGSLKRQLKQQRETIQALRTAVHRLEGEVQKRNKQVEMLLCAKYSTFTPVVESIRASHERNAVTHKLYKQIRELKAEVERKDEELGRVSESHKATTLMELVIEKEEYLAEVTRLRSLVKTQDEKLMHERRVVRELRRHRSHGSPRSPHWHHRPADDASGSSGDEYSSPRLHHRHHYNHNYHHEAPLRHHHHQGGADDASLDTRQPPSPSPPRGGRGEPPGQQRPRHERVAEVVGQMGEARGLTWASPSPPRRPGSIEHAVATQPMPSTKPTKRSSSKKRKKQAKNNKSPRRSHGAEAMTMPTNGSGTLASSNATMQVSIYPPDLEMQSFYREAHDHAFRRLHAKKEAERRAASPATSPPFGHAQRKQQVTPPPKPKVEAKSARRLPSRASPTAKARIGVPNTPPKPTPVQAAPPKPPSSAMRSQETIHMDHIPVVTIEEHRQSEEEQVEACTKIQAIMRGRQARRMVQDEWLGRSAARVQALFRGHRDRKIMKLHREVDGVQSEDVVKVQSVFRGFKARQAVATHQQQQVGEKPSPPTSSVSSSPLGRARPLPHRTVRPSVPLPQPPAPPSVATPMRDTAAAAARIQAQYRGFKVRSPPRLQSAATSPGRDAQAGGSSGEGAATNIQAVSRGHVKRKEGPPPPEAGPATTSSPASPAAGMHEYVEQQEAEEFVAPVTIRLRSDPEQDLGVVQQPDGSRAQGGGGGGGGGDLGDNHSRPAPWSRSRSQVQQQEEEEEEEEEEAAPGVQGDGLPDEGMRPHTADDDDEDGGIMRVRPRSLDRSEGPPLPTSHLAETGERHEGLRGDDDEDRERAAMASSAASSSFRDAGLPPRVRRPSPGGGGGGGAAALPTVVPPVVGRSRSRAESSHREGKEEASELRDLLGDKEEGGEEEDGGSAAYTTDFETDEEV